MVGTDTMLEQTLERVRRQELFGPPTIVGAAAQADEVGRLAPEACLILEPVPRGSAAAVALACLAMDPEAVLLILPSDHYITDPARLYEAVKRSLPAARAGHLITFGIQPGQSETGYGYITGGQSISPGVLEAQSFIEKPTKDVADRLIEAGNAFWNSGMFMFSAGAMLAELELHAPGIYAATKSAMERAATDGNRISPDRAALADCPNTSIDYAVMEHSDRIAVVPVQLAWSDVGSWAAVFDLSSKDSHGNAVDTRSNALDCRNCFVRSTGPQVITIGVEDLIVIATADQVLVVPVSEAQRVREAPQLLRRKEGG